MLRWSLKIAQVFGIAIYVHWTFLILLGWIAFIHFAQGKDAWQVAEGVLFVLTLFGCVVLHELGHALTARQFGIGTRDITLLPIGGVARLESIPEIPSQELLIALAGPAVNVVIAGLILVALIVGGAVQQATEVHIVGGLFFVKLLWVNIALVVFNMLPAFPMDGGRVLRSLLAMRMPRNRATHIAASVGQGMAILFGLGGLLTGQWVLVFVALFVFVGAQAEAQATEMRSLFRHALVRDAMNTSFETLNGADTLARAADRLLAGFQQDFPVVSENGLEGILHRSKLVEALGKESSESILASQICHACPVVRSIDPLDQAVAQMEEQECSTIPVVDNGQLIGLLTSENIGEWAMIQAVLSERREARQMRGQGANSPDN